jgi:hypothetical protein
MDRFTASTIATSLIHYKIDYCNFLLLNLPATQINRLQLVLNSAARAVTRTQKLHYITPILKSLHWLAITQRIKSKVLSLTHKSKKKLVTYLISAPFCHPQLTVLFVLQLSSHSIVLLLLLF